MQAKTLGQRAGLVVAVSAAALVVSTLVACSTTTTTASGGAAAALGAIPDACYLHVTETNDAGLTSTAPPTRCASDAECGAGARCDTALSPPTCIVLYCLPEAAACAHAEECGEGMQCHAGKCNPCNQCGDLCEVDFATSAAHCGDCNQPVGDKHVCENGEPVCAPATPLACGSTCVDPMTDPDNCGGCKKAVGANAACVKGKPACRDGFASCGSTCVDLENDGSDCGTCGHACGGGLSCSQGHCGGQITSDGKTTCTAVCASRGASCTSGDAHYSGPSSGHTQSIGCGAIAPASSSWPNGSQGCYMGTCYPGSDSGTLTGVACGCAG